MLVMSQSCALDKDPGGHLRRWGPSLNPLLECHRSSKLVPGEQRCDSSKLGPGKSSWPLPSTSAPRSHVHTWQPLSSPHCLAGSLSALRADLEPLQVCRLSAANPKRNFPCHPRSPEGSCWPPTSKTATPAGVSWFPSFALLWIWGQISSSKSQAMHGDLEYRLSRLKLCLAIISCLTLGELLNLFASVPSSVKWG